MVKNQPVRTKHIPQRTCVGCREVLAKRTLTRIVRSGTGIQIDPTGKMPGRGAYIHNQRSCWQSALKGRLANALKTEITEKDRQLLNDFLENLPDEDPQEINTP